MHLPLVQPFATGFGKLTSVLLAALLLIGSAIFYQNQMAGARWPAPAREFSQAEVAAEWATVAPPTPRTTAFNTTELLAELSSLMSSAERP